jgi:hypothetical protein
MLKERYGARALRVSKAALGVGLVLAAVEEAELPPGRGES